MNKIKFKFLFLIISVIIFILILLKFETNLFKKELNIQKIIIENSFHDGDILNNYANFLINNRITKNEEILYFAKIHPTQSLKQYIIDIEYISDQDLENHIKKIKNETDYINSVIRKSLDRYLSSKDEFSLLDEKTKLLVNYYKDQKDINFINLKIDKKSINIFHSNDKIRFFFLIFFSLVIAFFVTFFIKIVIKNQKNLLTLFDKL